jgi:hypothetical protein
MPSSLHLEPGKLEQLPVNAAYGNDYSSSRRIFVTDVETNTFFLIDRDKYILPNRRRCRRLRVPKKQAPGNTKEGHLRAVLHQRDDHRDLRHDPVDSKPTPTTKIQMAFHSGRRS